MSTQKEVAKLANVSFITVSRVINKMGNVKPETKKRVEEAIKELNYYPNSIAQGLNSNKIKTLVVQSPLPQNTTVEGTSYYRRLLIGIEQFSITKGYDVLISAQRGSADKVDFLKPFYERKADGVIIIGSKPTPEHLNKIYEDDIPCVVIGDRDKTLKFNYIDTENFQGMQTATDYLISNGHTKIGYIKGNAITQNTTDRYNGFLDSMYKHNLVIDENFIYSGNYSKESGGEALRYFMTLKDRPTAVISSTDLMAIGFYEEATRLKINIPKDFSIIGFDGHEICSYTNPPLATMYQPLEEMGQNGAEMLIDIIEGQIKINHHILFPVEIIPRGSISKLN